MPLKAALAFQKTLAPTSPFSGLYKLHLILQADFLSILTYYLLKKKTFFWAFEYNLNKPLTQWSNKESHVNVGTSSNVITWLLHMAVQVSPLIKTPAEVLLVSLLRYQHCIYYKNDKEPLINRWWKITPLNVTNTRRRKNRDIKTSFLCVFG